MANGGQMEAEGGEVIINKRSSAMFKPQLSAINQAGGGVAFAKGGTIPQAANGVSLPTISGVSGVRPQVNIDSGVGGSGGVMQDQRVYVVESDITGVQNKVSVMEQIGTI